MTMTIYSPKPRNKAATVARFNPKLKAKQSIWVIIALFIGLPLVVEA